MLVAIRLVRDSPGWSAAMDGASKAYVEEVLGRPARDFSDYVRRTAATDVWRT
jgi:hypothetical protein